MQNFLQNFSCKFPTEFSVDLSVQLSVERSVELFRPTLGLKFAWDLGGFGQLGASDARIEQSCY